MGRQAGSGTHWEVTACKVRFTFLKLNLVDTHRHLPCAVLWEELGPQTWRDWASALEELL